jgi:hypothetical protein
MAKAMLLMAAVQHQERQISKENGSMGLVQVPLDLGIIGYTVIRAQMAMRRRCDK